jgi:signal transduction histidine kinase
VARDALANVQIHVQARTVRISPCVVESFHARDQAWLRLVIADDGVRFDPEKLDRSAEGRLGLRLLVDRVESLGGQLVIGSAAGQGTTAQTELPASATRETDGT